MVLHLNLSIVKICQKEKKSQVVRPLKQSNTDKRRTNHEKGESYPE